MNVTFAAIQLKLTDDRETNVARVAEQVRLAAQAGAKVILPSELFEGFYFCREEKECNFLRAMPAEGHPTIALFQKLAAELGVVIPVSFFERSGPEYFNSIAIVDADGRNLGIYRKSHIPDGPGYEEKFYFRPGDTGFRAWNTRFGTLGVGICWDQWFPESAREMMLRGADVLLYPTAIGSEPANPTLDTKDRWQRAMIGHAVCNVVPIVAANRTGDEENQRFYGHSFLCDESGAKLSELPDGSEGFILSTFDLAAARSARASWGFFRDRRTDLYSRANRADNE